jgi:hypothetical protein
VGELEEVLTWWNVGRYGGGGVFAVFVLRWLLTRGDDILRRNIDILIKQGDNALERMEQAERELREARAKYHDDVDALRSALAECRGLNTGEIPLPGRD